MIYYKITVVVFDKKIIEERWREDQIHEFVNFGAIFNKVAKFVKF